MAFIYPNHRGLAYGDGYMNGTGTMGSIVRISGNDIFTVNTDPLKKSFGLLIKNYSDGEMPGIYCGGGVYQTDVFEGTIVAGDDLMCSTNGKLAKHTSTNLVIARAISVSSGILKFQLLI